MPTTKEEVLMKHLRITEGKGQYSIDGSSWTDMDNINKSELLKLVDIALTAEFFMEPYRKELIRNPAHEIIYRNIHAKLEELVTKKDRFKDESEQLYREAIQKYRTQ